jgi:hypothetical protein
MDVEMLSPRHRFLRLLALVVACLRFLPPAACVFTTSS